MIQNHWVTGEIKVLDCSFMESGSPEYESIRGHYLFSGLDQEDFDALMQSASRVTLEKGEILFHRGDNARYFYFVDSGHLELNLVAPTGQKKVLEVLGHGRTFAEAVAFMQEH